MDYALLFTCVFVCVYFYLTRSYTYVIFVEEISFANPLFSAQNLGPLRRTHVLIRKNNEVEVIFYSRNFFFLKKYRKIILMINER